MAVKKYSLKKDGNTYCSKHTKVKEMASINSAGKVYSDTVKVDTKLMEMIEKLFDKLNCKKYVISSGYRTSAHDKAVGGSGKGQHTTGKAVDACFYDKDGKVISTKIVSCVAQDLGFKGIANISDKFCYIHLDMRSTGKYYGDERKGFNTVTSDFRKYYGISNADIAKYTGETKKESKPKVKYHAKYTGKSPSIAEALKSLKIDSSFSNRKKIAKANGIKSYIGTANQNSKLLNLLKKGKLIKP